MSTRRGGVSRGEYATFNLGEYSGDLPEHVAENRRILSTGLGIAPDRLIFPYQTHEDRILIVDEAFTRLSADERKQASSGFDAVITHLTDYCIGVTTADCVPLIAYCPEKNVIAAIHAGWRGTVACIAPKTIRRMCEIYGCDPREIRVGIGASISAEQFEVGEEVYQSFLDAAIDMSQNSYIHPETGKHHIDLQGVNYSLLLQEGLQSEHIEVMRRCTRTESETFFSARRQGIHSGRMVSGVMLRGHSE